jgi:iron complex transport system substrate-binding protein
MFSRRSLLLSPLALEAAFLKPCWASDFIDSAGRKVQLSNSIKRILPAGPPAEALLDSLAPEKLVRLVGPWTDVQKLLDIEAVCALQPDLIVDYGAIDESYIAFANKVQTETGIPYLLLDGRLVKVPQIIRILGSIVHKDGRAKEIAKTAEHALQELAPIMQKPVRERISVYYARGSDGLRAVRAGSSLAEAIALAGGRNVVLPGEGTFSVMSADDVAILKPSVIVLANPTAARPGAPLRQALPAETLFLVDPGLPYGWVERPPSLNRLTGALWLASRFYPKEISFSDDDARTMNVALFNPFRPIQRATKGFVDAHY